MKEDNVYKVDVEANIIIGDMSFDVSARTLEIAREIASRKAETIIENNIKNDDFSFFRVDDYILTPEISTEGKEIEPAPTLDKWLNFAVLKDEDFYRRNLQFINVEDGEIAATNGHVLHFAETKLENGFYTNKLKLLPDIEEKFPNWKAVVPEEKEWKKAKFSELTAGITEEEIRYRTIENRSFDETLLWKAINGAEEFEYSLDVKSKDYHTSIIVKSNFGKAVIMPVRV